MMGDGADVATPAEPNGASGAQSAVQVRSCGDGDEPDEEAAVEAEAEAEAEA